MHRTLLLVLTASAGVSLACSDRSPTSPDVEANPISAESAGTPALKTTEHTRHVIVVPPRPETFLQPGIWGSEKAGLTITKGSATLDILSLALPGGGCFGSYGEMTPPIPNGPFSIAGTYTQLIGAYPGKIQYGARYSGAVEGHRMSIEVTVPALQQSFGPYLLTNGVNNAWSPCLYP